MTDEIKRLIFASDAAGTQVLIEKAMELYGLDMTDPNATKAFLTAHPGFQLPDLYLTLGASREIFISHHSPLYNDLAHKHDFFELIYVAEGTAQDEIDGQKVTLQKGEMCIHNPSALHKITKCGPEDLLINVLISKETFHGFLYYNVIRDKGLERFFENYLQTGDTSASYLAFHNTSPETESLMDMLFHEYFSENKSEALLDATLLLLLGRLLRQYDGSEDEITAYLIEHLDAVTLESAAAHFRYHPKYFSSLIKKKTGMGFQALITDLRLRKAENYLRFTSLSVEQIAAAVGYANASAFYGAFRKKMGLTPKAYREQHMN